MALELQCFWSLRNSPLAKSGEETGAPKNGGNKRDDASQPAIVFHAHNMICSRAHVGVLQDWRVEGKDVFNYIKEQRDLPPHQGQIGNSSRARHIVDAARADAEILRLHADRQVASSTPTDAGNATDAS
jgi:hypothetical protein